MDNYRLLYYAPIHIHGFSTTNGYRRWHVVYLRNMVCI